MSRGVAQGVGFGLITMEQIFESPDTQNDVIVFLSSAKGHPGGGPVEVVQTHGAMIFLAGDVALKIKRAVRYDYMDLSTLDLREADGHLALDGKLDDALARDLGQGVFDCHVKTPQRSSDGATMINDILDELGRVFADLGDLLNAAQIARFHQESRAALDDITPLLRRRGAAGHIRRCHGDLHLHNLVLLNGKPVPFDALEFDEVLGTCDVLYDLAFLIMDLRHRALGRAANIVLNAYLLAGVGHEDDGLATLPLFMAIRAAIRAMVLAQTARTTGSPMSEEAELYLADAVAVLSPPKPALVLVGGLSGSGKTTVAQELAPQIGASPGAVLLRSDTERKALIGADPQTPLAESAYTLEARAAIYHRMLGRAGAILRTGQSVLIDATFLDPADRSKAAAVATNAEVALHQLWLDAPLDVLIDRVTARRCF